MTDIAHCSRCGCELPAETPDELCPACLLQAALEGDLSDGDGANGENSDPRLAVTTPQGGGFVPPDAEELAPLFPQLEVLKLLGHGGMGAVYQARQKKLDRLVALKIIRPEGAADPAFAERFMREARTLARLNHPGIVAIHDFGEVETAGPTDGRQYYFVMEYVDGANLRQLMENGELNAEQAFAIVPQICDALQFAHDEGVVHRDIKPENVLVDTKGRVKIADFGLAKLATRSPEDFTLTATHQVMGTPRYMAPEQMAGSNSVDHRADIYSLGVVLYEMLTGEVPMGQFAPPSHKASVDARLDNVVMRALASEPERRFQKASELRSDVDRISSGAWKPRPAQPAGGPQRTGVSTIMERELIGAWRWVAGENEPSRQTTQSYPTSFALALTIAGILMLLVPWCDVTLLVTDDDHQSELEQTNEVVAAVVDERVNVASASMLTMPSPRPERRRSSEPLIQQASLSLLAQDAGSSLLEPPVHVMPGAQFTFRGFDLIPGAVAGANFAMMTLLILMFPTRSRRSLWWNLTLSLFAAGALATTITFTSDIGYARLRVSVDPQLISSSPGSNSAELEASPLRLAYWQDGSSRSMGERHRQGRVDVYLKSLKHSVVYRGGFYGSLGLSLAVLILGATGVRNSIADRQGARPIDSLASTDHRSADPTIDSKTLSRLRAEVRLDVSGPSLMLLSVGILSTIGHGIAFAVCISQPFEEENAALALPGIVIGIAMILAGLNLRNLASRGWVQVGAIAGLLPLNAAWILTSIAGIWAINTLQKPHVREAFLQAEQHRIDG